MAKKGLDYVAFAKYEYSNGTTTYSDGVHLSPAASFNAAINTNVQNDYGDNYAVESVSEVTGGTLSVELTNEDSDIYSFLLGAVKGVTGATGSEVTSIKSKTSDVPPLVGAAAIGESGSKYKIRLYKKCQFSEPNDDNTTRQEATAFGHITLSGNILIPEDKEWRIIEEYNTLDAAIAALKTLFGIT